MAKRTRKEAIRKELKKKEALASQKEAVKEEPVIAPEEELPEIETFENIDDENQKRLEALLSMIEDAFPYGDVYIRQAKEETIGRETDEDVLFRNGLYYVDTLISLGSNTQAALNSLDRLDYLSSHKDVIAKIKAEYDL